MDVFFLLSGVLMALIMSAGLWLTLPAQTTVTQRAVRWLSVCSVLFAVWSAWPSGFMPEIALAWHRAGFIVLSLLATAWAHVAVAVSGTTVRRGPMVVSGYFFVVLSSLLAPTHWGFTQMAPSLYTNLWPAPGQVYVLWAAALVAYWFWVWCAVRAESRMQHGVRRAHLQYATWAHGFTGLSLLPIVLMPFHIGIPPVLHVSAGVLFLLLLMGLRRVRFYSHQDRAEHALRIVLSLGAAAVWAWGVLTLITLPSTPGAVFFFSVTIIGVLLSAYALLQTRLAVRIMGFGRWNRMRGKLAQLRDEKTVYLSVRDFEDQLQYAFRADMGITGARIFLIPEEAPLAFLVDYFTHETAPIVTEEIHLRPDFFTENVLAHAPTLSSVGAVLLPLRTGEGLARAVFALGGKTNGDAYTQEEMHELNLFAKYMGLELTAVNFTESMAAQVHQKTQDLRQAYEDLKELDKAKDSFLSIASHELRTPMTIIKGYADFLLSGEFGTVPDEQREFIERIQRSTDGLIKLVNNILDFSKIEAGKMEYHYEPIVLAPLVGGIVADFQMLCGKKAQQLVLQNNLPDGLAITTDPEKITLMLRNLISNAHKFTPKEGRVTVTLTPSPTGGVQLAVADSGIGIPADKLETVFEKFSQVGSVLQKHEKGTGLGLPIVKRVIEHMGGSISLSSTPKVGTTFTVQLPAVAK